MTRIIITQESKRDSTNSPLYRVRVAEKAAHSANQDHLLFTAAWELATSAMQPGDYLTEEHTNNKPITMTYEQVQENIREWTAFDATN